jgi:hypothetical protein
VTALRKINSRGKSVHFPLRGRFFRFGRAFYGLGGLFCVPGGLFIVTGVLFAGAGGLFRLRADFLRGGRTFGFQSGGGWVVSQTYLHNHNQHTDMNNEMIRNHYDTFSRMEAFGLKYGAEFAPASRAGGAEAAPAHRAQQVRRAGGHPRGVGDGDEDRTAGQDAGAATAGVNGCAIGTHRKPGYDPCELFIVPAIPFPGAKVGKFLLKRKPGIRGLLDVSPLDATLVRGSHGRDQVPDSEKPVLIGSSLKVDSAQDIHSAIIAEITAGGVKQNNPRGCG